MKIPALAVRYAAATAIDGEKTIVATTETGRFMG
jgi:hypothetical protein